MGRPQTAETRRKIGESKRGNQYGKGVKRAHDLTGRRFGRLVVLEQAGRTNLGQVRWLCLCDCGREHVVERWCLAVGNTRSCGCLRRELSRARIPSPESLAKNRAANLGNRNVLDAPIKGECVYCGEPGTTYDHVIPRGRPGWDDPDNLVVACLPCNSAKGDRTPEEWFSDSTPSTPQLMEV